MVEASNSNIVAGVGVPGGSLLKNLHVQDLFDVILRNEGNTLETDVALEITIPDTLKAHAIRIPREREEATFFPQPITVEYTTTLGNTRSFL